MSGLLRSAPNLSRCRLPSYSVVNPMSQPSSGCSASETEASPLTMFQGNEDRGGDYCNQFCSGQQSWKCPEGSDFFRCVSQTLPRGVWRSVVDSVGKNSRRGFTVGAVALILILLIKAVLLLPDFDDVQLLCAEQRIPYLECQKSRK